MVWLFSSAPHVTFVDAASDGDPGRFSHSLLSDIFSLHDPSGLLMPPAAKDISVGHVEETAPANRLPPTLWHRVASFIPLHVIRGSGLYALNRALLEYYLEKRYRIARLDCNNRSGDFSQFANFSMNKFSSPMVARAVKVLKMEVSERVMPYNFWAKVVRSVSTLSPKNPNRRPPVVFKHLPECLELMENLESIEYEVTGRNTVPLLDFSNIFPLALSPALEASKNTLTKLSLGIGLDFIPKLGLSRIIFPNLQHFSFRFNPSCWLTNPNNRQLIRSAQSALIPFIKRHSGTILRLSLKFQGQTYRFGDAMLSNVPHCPRLRDLSIHMQLVVDLPAMGLYHILHLHSGQLIRLELQLKMPFRQTRTGLSRECLEWWKSQGFMGVTFPRLEHLKCCFERYDRYELFLWYLCWIACQVKSLDVLPSIYVYKHFTYHEVNLLTRLFREAGNQCRLETLYIRVEKLTPPILKLLAVRLPRLRSLHITFERVGLQEDEDTLAFSYSEIPWLRAYRAFAGEPLSDWALETVILNDQVRERPRHQPGLFKAAMEKALPSVKSFKYCGQVL